MPIYRQKTVFNLPLRVDLSSFKPMMCRLPPVWAASLSDKWTVNDAARMSPNRCGSSLDCRERNPRALLLTAAVSFGHPCDAKIVNSRLAVVKEIRMDLGEAAMSEKNYWWVLPPTSSDLWDRRRPTGPCLWTCLETWKGLSGSNHLRKKIRPAVRRGVSFN